jgi:hypothetical protein
MMKNKYRIHLLKFKFEEIYLKLDKLLNDLKVLLITMIQNIMNENILQIYNVIAKFDYLMIVRKI